MLSLLMLVVASQAWATAAQCNVFVQEEHSMSRIRLSTLPPGQYSTCETAGVVKPGIEQQLPPPPASPRPIAPLFAAAAARAPAAPSAHEAAAARDKLAAAAD